MHVKVTSGTVVWSASLLTHVDIGPIRYYINFLSVDFQKILGNLPGWKYERFFIRYFHQAYYPYGPCFRPLTILF